MKFKKTISFKDAVVVCHTVDGQSVEEISKRLGIPERTIYRWIENREEIARKNKELLKEHIKRNIYKYGRCFDPRSNKAALQRLFK